jgi:hypothetical protein
MNKLPNELLIMIFSYVKQDKKYIRNRPLEIRKEDIYQFSEECDTCIIYAINNNGRSPFNIWESGIETNHVKQHKEKIVRERINERCKRSKENYKAIKQLMICKRWRQLNLKEYKEAILDIRNTREVINKIINYTVEQPQLIEYRRRFTNNKHFEIRRTTRNYSRSSNILLINKKYREKYYDKIVKKESLKIRNKCKLCKQETDTEIIESNTLPRRILDYSHTTRYKIMYNKERKETYKIIGEGITRWTCKNGCYKHCLNSPNHCNQGRHFEKELMTPQEYIEWRNEMFPKKINHD